MRFVLESVFRCTPAALFEFHERADALDLLSPQDGSVRVIQTPASLQVGAEAIILLGVGPLRKKWVARHTVYEPPYRFVDEQVSGPFKSWRHEHLIQPHPEGAQLRDQIDFELPLGLLGRPAAPFVMAMLKKSFAVRHAITRSHVEGSQKVPRPATTAAQA